MYYWQYKLHMKGGKNNAKLDLNPSLSAEKRAAKVARFFCYIHSKVIPILISCRWCYRFIQ